MAVYSARMDLRISLIVFLVVASGLQCNSSTSSQAPATSRDLNASPTMPSDGSSEAVATGPVSKKPLEELSGESVLISHTADGDTFGSESAIAVVRVLETQEECSGAGGSHVSLEVVEVLQGHDKAAHVKHVHLGGHALYEKQPVDALFLASILPSADVIFSNPGWCINFPYQFQGRVQSMLRVKSVKEARLAFSKTK